MSRVMFTRALKREGFRKDFHTRDPLVYNKVVGARSVDVQLWKDGKHRTSHMLDGRGSTYPTEFNSVAGMLRAIQHELTRSDHTVPA
jgi:hypothetical protein